MARVDQLKALLKSYEAAEYDALLSQKEVDRVVEERTLVVEKLQEKRHSHEALLKKTLGSGRLDALQGGDSGLVASRTAYGARLKKELGDLAAVLSRREAELERALVRAKEADADVVAARVECRKVEQLLAGHHQRDRIRGLARDEQISEEIRQFQNRKRDK